MSTKMEGALKLATTILTQLFEGPRGAAQRPPGLIVRIVCLLSAGLAIAAATGFLMSALWVVVPDEWGAAAAPLLCAGALIILSAIFFLVGTISWRYQAPPPTHPLEKILQQVDTSKLVREYMIELLIAAAVFGLIAGNTTPKSPRNGGRR